MHVPLQRQPRAALVTGLARASLQCLPDGILFVLLRCATHSGWRRAMMRWRSPRIGSACWGLVALTAAGTRPFAGREELDTRSKVAFTLPDCTSPGYGMPVSGPDPQVESPTPPARALGATLPG